MDLHPHMVRIVLSGEMDRDLTFKTVHCAHQYLAKPCDADVLKATLARAFSLRRLINDRRLKTLLPRLESLPSLPTLYTEIIAEIQAPNSSFKKVGELIARDVSMTAKILQLVNSAFFGLARRIANPQEAVSLIGYDTVKALVLSAKVFSQFEVKRIPGLWLDALWRHSMETSPVRPQHRAGRKTAAQVPGRSLHRRDSPRPGQADPGSELPRRLRRGPGPVPPTAAPPLGG